MLVHSRVHTSSKVPALEVDEQDAVFDQAPEAERLEQLVP